VLDAYESERDAEALTPRSVYAGRDPEQAREGNREYYIVGDSCARIMRGAFLAALQGDATYLGAATRQLESIFDDTVWPDWRDLAHLKAPVDLRHGQFSRAVALAYDWAHELWTAEERAWIVEQIDRRCIRNASAFLAAMLQRV
jgi:hypothetical protein